jgi:hypothetical protein
MTPNLERAATAAAKTLIDFNVTSAPVAPLRILKSIPGVLVLSFAEMAEEIGVERKELMSKYDSANKDAFTLVKEISGKLRYFVGYNLLLPEYLLQRAIARELGHIILGHDGSRPEDVRMLEAMFFARHLLCPRPLIKAIQDAGIPITVETLGLITGCYERCLIGMQKSHGVHVPKEMNRQIKRQFTPYVENFVDCRSLLTKDDDSMLVNFGTFMDGYEE